MKLVKNTFYFFDKNIKSKKNSFRQKIRNRADLQKKKKKQNSIIVKKIEPVVLFIFKQKRKLVIEIKNKFNKIKVGVP